MKMQSQKLRADRSNKKWWIAMLYDVQFWVPLAVLFGGLALLQILQ